MKKIVSIEENIRQNQNRFNYKDEVESPQFYKVNIDEEM